MTQQQAFNKVWKHFVVNKGKPGVRTGFMVGRCVYQNDDGCRCGIGVLLTEQEIKRIKHKGELGLAVDEMKKKYKPKSLVGLTVKFLTPLQICHDSAIQCSTFTLVMQAKLSKLAKEFKLRIPKQ